MKVILWLLLLVACTIACHKKDANIPMAIAILGKWQLIEASGGISGGKVQLDKTFTICISNSSVFYYANDTLVGKYSYELTRHTNQGKEFWMLNNATAELKGNTLTLVDMGPDLYRSTYIRQAGDCGK